MKSEAGADGTPESERRAARVARYKEERRAQLASQFSTLAAASDDIRSTRTSRLRAAAKEAAKETVQVTPTTTLTRKLSRSKISPGRSIEPTRKKSDASMASTPGASPRKTSSATSSPRKTSTTTPPRKTSSTSLRRGSRDKVSPAKSTDSISSAGKTRTTSNGQDAVKRVTASPASSETGTADKEGTLRRRAERDKTAQRMSQLNLGLSHEAADPPEYLGQTDEGPATGRRRARRTAADASLTAKSVQLISVNRLATSPRLTPPKDPAPSTKEVRRVRTTARKSPPKNGSVSPKHVIGIPTPTLAEEASKSIDASNPMPPSKHEGRILQSNGSDITPDAASDGSTHFLERTRKLSKTVETASSSSILRPASGDEEPTTKSPVSILKRKSSREEHHHAPPVTFSLDDEELASRRTQGILKKHSSLDEAEVQRRRSCSPESKPILKRRSSLEELVRRAQSPDPQSILKRRESREEDISETAASPGILKRTGHVSIATAAELVLAEQGVRPILKKISSDEYATADSSSDGTPRPILKKKSDAEEGRPKKTILKSSRKSSCEESYHSDSGRFADEGRYLGRAVMLDDSEPERRSAESELETVLRKRRSLELGPDFDVSEACEESVETRQKLPARFVESIGVEEQPLSVADRISRMEGAMTTGAVPKRLARDKERFKTQPVTREDFHGLSSRSAALPDPGEPLHRSQELPSMGDEAAPPSPSLPPRACMKAMAEEAAARRKARHRDDAARFQTQPVTMDEVQLATKLKQDEDEATMSMRAAKEKMFEHAQQTLRGILKPAGATLSRTTPEPDVSTHLRSVLKKDSSVDEPNLSDQADPPPRSILKAESSDFRSSSSEDERPGSRPRRPDLTEILYGVEKAHAKRTPPVSEKENRESANQKKVNEERKIDLKELERKINSKKMIDEFNQSRKTSSSKLAVERLNGNHKEALLDERKSNKDLNKFDSQERQAKESASDSDRKRGAEGEMSSEGESSGGREVKRIIRNEAVARRRQMAVAKQRSNGVTSSLVPLGKSQSHSALSQQCHTSLGFENWTREDEEDESGSRPVTGGIRRSMTQPMEDLEDKEEIRETSSIADRLAALKKSGNTGWQKRLPKLKAEDDLAVITTNNRINAATATAAVVTPVISAALVADRRDKLDAAAQGWKKRVGVTDAVNFSVAGRMREVRAEVIASPILATERQKRTPRANRFRSKAVHANNVKSTPTSPQKDPRDSFRFKRSMSAPGGDEDSGPSSPLGSVVAVPRADNETFTSFFASTSVVTSMTTSTCAADLDLDSVGASADRMLAVQRRTVKVQRRRQREWRNPIKALAARTDLRDEYTEVCTGVAEKEMRRIQVEKLSKGSNMAVEALAGLASREDFTAVSLKRATSVPSGAMLPYKELMLMQVKGRRHVQTRLVAPLASSINNGDNFVLVTPTQVFNWVGRYSNVIECARGAEIAALVAQRHDLGCSADAVTTVAQGGIKEVAFWRALGAAPGEEAAPAGHPDEDEIYESSVVDTNMVYEVVDNELVPVDEYWGSIPRIEMLDPAKVLVLDFGSELYVWSGKNATPEARKAGVALVNELHEDGYDYTECDICPISAAQELGSRSTKSDTPRSGDRPAWTLVAKVSQHMETVLFREKFLDWPDFTRTIRAHGNEEECRTPDPTVEVRPCDASVMYDNKLPEPSLELEGSHLGRGTCHFDAETNRRFEVKCVSVSVWHVEEFEHTLLAPAAVGQFHAGDSYVVRWLYTVTPVGRELGGMPSKHLQASGRDRCAYFCWQGDDASLNEKGAAALITVELDSERGAQLRVAQGHEPPAFLNLFTGGMVVHAGRRAERRKSSWRLYMVRGEAETEAVLVEVACSTRQLRSRASVVLADTRAGTLAVWYGCKAQPHTRRVALAAARRLAETTPAELGIRAGMELVVQEVHEGKEPKSFLEGIGGGNRQLYHSLLDRSTSYNDTPRLFHLTSSSGSFVATELAGTYRLPGAPNAFPFLQSELYSASQPALFLVDTGRELWLWQGWWPDKEGVEERGSGAVRWQAERRAAMHTVVEYWSVGHQGRPRARLVWAGLEPLEFTNLFPMWTDRDDVAEMNMSDGRKAGEVLSVETELARLTRSTYPIARLLQRPLPDGVDPSRLEIYLDAKHYMELLGMTKEEFEELPTWKQTKVKKEAGLF